MLKSIGSFFKKKTRTVAPRLPTAPDYFDEAYYVQQYPEVTAADMQGWWHFFHHGYREGRWPCALQAVQIEPSLWGSDATAAEQQLRSLLQHRNEAEKSSAAWFLGRWYAAHGNWAQVAQVMAVYIACDKPVPGLIGPKLLWLEHLRRIDVDQAVLYLQYLEQQYGQRVDLSLMQMNLQNELKDVTWWQPLNHHYTKADLKDVSVEVDNPTFDGLKGSSTQPTQTSQQPSTDLVSVVVPAYNAAQTIVTALNGLLAQTWSHLEVLVVDDASTDDTVALVQQLAQQDSRIRLVQLPTNQGAYAARNEGLAQSQGQFITVHDSDDWSHPQKIEQQLLPLFQQPKLQGTLSHWVRTSETLFFGSWASPEDWNGLVHRNVSSLLIRRHVVTELGFWDAVVCSADTEYYYRILKAYGPQALYEVHEGLPLAFGRVRSDSLTQRSETHIFSIFNGLRQHYRQAYEQWHGRSQERSDLYMSQYMDTRAFEVDAKMLRK